MPAGKHKHEVAREWLASRAVIVDFLREVCPGMSRADLEHNAAALIARLASHDPPILLEFSEEEDASRPTGFPFDGLGEKQGDSH